MCRRIPRVRLSEQRYFLVETGTRFGVEVGRRKQKIESTQLGFHAFVPASDVPDRPFGVIMERAEDLKVPFVGRSAYFAGHNVVDVEHGWDERVGVSEAGLKVTGLRSAPATGVLVAVQDELP
jgi:hypothetical protein